MIYLLMSDLAGLDSVKHLVDAKKIVHIPIQEYDDFVNAIKLVLPKVSAGDLVIVDTLNRLSEIMRAPIARAGKEVDFSLAGSIKALSDGEKYALPSYTKVKEVVITNLSNIVRRGGHVITILHEMDAEGDMGVKPKKRLPSINQDFWSGLKGCVSDIFRMYHITEPMMDNAGEVRFPAYTRFLQLRDSEEFVAKLHVQPEYDAKVPKVLSNPTLPKLYEILGKKPAWLLLYGPPGVGKTTLACSEAAETKGK